MQQEDAAPRGAASRWLRLALTALVAVVMFAMMMLVTVDVASRGLLNRPVKGSDELVAFLLAILIFAALPLVSWDRQHITVTLFERWIRGRFEKVLATVLSAVSTAVVAAIAYRLWIQARLMAEGQHITGALEWPIAPVVFFMSALAAMTAVIMLSLTVDMITSRRRTTFNDTPVEHD
jgi:TRAP-type C4-dicarboxylate transport system permease small subunit